MRDLTNFFALTTRIRAVVMLQKGAPKTLLLYGALAKATKRGARSDDDDDDDVSLTLFS